MSVLQHEKHVIAVGMEQQRIKSLQDELEGLRYWMHARVLSSSLSRTCKLVDEIKERLEAKPVVAVVGSTGAGKSTLVNALVGAEVVKMGVTRPTTQKIAIVSNLVSDAQQLLTRLDTPSRHFELHHNFGLRNVVLLDTPDTDSMKHEEYRALLEQSIGLADILVCTFNAENPKRLDNLKFLGDWVKYFRGDDVYLVLNQCDRIMEKELLRDVLPDFKKHIAGKQVWGKNYKVFCVSARDRLASQDWEEGASPLHGYNDFEELQQAIKEIEGGTLLVDQRLARVKELRIASEGLIGESAGEMVQPLQEAMVNMKGLVKKLDTAALKNLTESVESKRVVKAALWDEVSEHLWSFLGIHAGFMRSLAAFGLAFRRISILTFMPALFKGVRGFMRPKRQTSTIEDAVTEIVMPAASVAEGKEIECEWPKIAELLIAGGFDTVIRDPHDHQQVLPQRNISSQIWNNSVKEAIRRHGKILSRWFVQIPLILPCVSVVAFTIGFLILEFVEKKTLQGNFLPHTAVLLLLLWLLSCSIFNHFVSRESKKVFASAKLIAEKKIESSEGNEKVAEGAALWREVEWVLRWANKRAQE